MARVTIDDCLHNVENRFELVLVASRRARDLATGRGESTLEWGNDRSTVVALREIAEGHVDKSYLNKKPEPTTEQDDEIERIAKALGAAAMEQEAQAEVAADLEAAEIDAATEALKPVVDSDSAAPAAGSDDASEASEGNTEDK